MNEFDKKAGAWDSNQMHWDRSAAIVKELINHIHPNRSMSALEYGAGTGIASFMLRDYLKEITMIDSSSGMVRIIEEKIKAAGSENMKVLLFDLEKEDPANLKFDLVITQLVLHHVTDIKNIIHKFNLLINPGGYLAIADLYPEDGSFHGEGFSGHNGFDPDELSSLAAREGFKNISIKKCYVISKKISETAIKNFDVFLLIAQKP